MSSKTCNFPSQPSATEMNSAMNECVNEQRQHALDDLLSRSLLALLGLAIIAFAFGYAMAGRVLSRVPGYETVYGKLPAAGRKLVDRVTVAPVEISTEIAPEVADELRARIRVLSGPLPGSGDGCDRLRLDV